jgi:hypothetical protein
MVIANVRPNSDFLHFYDTTDRLPQRLQSIYRVVQFAVNQ